MGKQIRENITQFVVGNFGDVKSELVIYVWYENLRVRKQIRENITQFFVGNFEDVKSELVIYVWYENRRVGMISIFLGKDPVKKAKMV